MVNSIEEYTKACKRTEPTREDYGRVITRLAHTPFLLELIHAQMGLAGEVGELTDTIKRAVFYGKELDALNIKEETGDLMWYLSIVFYYIWINTGSSPIDVLNQNIEKLKLRYPEKFSELNALARADKEDPEHLG